MLPVLPATTIINTGDITTTGGGNSYILGSRAISAITYTSGDIYINNSGLLTTYGQFSRGINAYTAPNSTDDINVINSGAISTTGDDAEGIQLFGYSSGTTTLENTADITTTGDRSAAIASYAIGGFTNMAGALVTPVANGGVILSNSGDLTTDGADSSGISVMTAVSGDVTITSSGSITANGENSNSISIAAPASVSNDITLTGSTIWRGGTGTGAGVNLQAALGGSTLTVAAGTTLTAGSGNAVLGGAGNETINNTGTITGDLILGEGTNVVNNADGATITGDLITGAGDDIFANDGTFIGTADLGEGDNTFTNTSFFTFVGDFITGDGDDDITNTGFFQGTIDLGAGANAALNDVGGVIETTEVSVGAGNTFTNAGTLSPGGEGDVQTLTINGDFIQSETGTLVIEVGDTSGDSDILVVNGDAEIGGVLQIEIAEASAGPLSFDIVSVSGDVTDNGIEIVASPGLEVEFDGITLTTEVDFVTADFDLAPNQTNVANILNGALAAGVAGFDPIFDGLLNDTTDAASFSAALDSLSGEVHASAQFAFNTNGLFVGDSITNVLAGFASADQASGGNQTASSSSIQALALAPDETAERLFGADLVLNEEGEVAKPDRRHFVFSRGLFRDVEIDDDGNGGETDIQNRGFIVGGGINFSERFQGGISAGYLRSEVDVDSLDSEVEADSAIVSAFGRFQDGPFDASATLGYIYSDVESERGVAVGTLIATASADYDANTFFGAGELGYTKLVDDFALRPFISGGFSVTNRDGFTETGAGAANLVVQSETDVLGQFSIGASASTSFTIKSALIVPRVEVAFDQLIGDVTPGSTATFAPGGAAFTVVGAEPGSSRGRVNVGAATKFSERFTGFVEYQGIFSGADTEHGVRSGLRFRF